jgi:S1-C subfamily serine protease
LIALLLAAAGAAESTEPDWNQTIAQVLDSVVILHMDRTRPFDGNSQSSSQASGFVIDAEQGLILTNRHVVTTGPTVAQAIFHNKEEVDLVPLYRDPVHDFGVFRYDPDDLEFIEPVSLPLAPDQARIGTDIRVIGNDAAEQISILAGTLSRLDRDAPHWDFNTFYLQAASSTSGGSSGSPVFDVEGRVVALNAGARMDAATSLFLPLPRVQRAVEALQSGRIPSRGTIQTVFAYRTFDELERLGLPESVEAAVRSEWGGTGMLTVARINEGGPAHGVLEEGDILRAIDGRPVYDFVPLEAALDDAVGQSVALEVLRGGEAVSVDVAVRDLHALIPSAYFEIGEGVMHDLSYHSAVRVPRPTAGVSVARSGRLFASAGIPRGAVIERIGDAEIARLDDFVTALSAVPDGERVQIRWTDRDAPVDKRVTSLLMNRSFWPVQRCERVDAVQPVDGPAPGDWPCESVEPPEPVEERTTHDVALPDERKRKFRAATHSLVRVTFRPQLNVDSIHGNQRESPGVLIDPERGLVLTDRNVAPATTGEVRVQLADAPSVAARIRYMDPVANAAIVQFDPNHVDLSDVEAPQLLDTPLEPGDDLVLIALDREGGIYRQSVDIDRFQPARFADPATPRYQIRDVDFLRLGELDRPTLGGVLTDKRGRIVGLLQRFERDDHDRYRTSLYAVPVRFGLQAIDRWTRGVESVPDLGADFVLRPLVDARENGLPEPTALTLRAHAPERPLVLEIRSLSGDTPAREVLEVGDFLVALDGRPVTTFQEVRDAVSARPDGLPATIIRNGEPREVTLEADRLPVAGTERVVLWGGALVQEEPPAVAIQSQTPKAGVYISWYYGGTPAQRYDLGYGRRIVEVDGQPIDGLDAFLDAVRDKPDRAPVKLRMQGLRGEEWVDTLKLDLRYWPTQEFRRVEGDDGEPTWVRELVSPTPPT